MLTFFRYPRSQWKSWRTTNSIERLHLEFRRRVKTQGRFPTADAALALLAGVAERVAMQVTGHRTRSVFDRYHIVSPADLQEAARKLDMAREQASPAASKDHLHTS